MRAFRFVVGAGLAALVFAVVASGGTSAPARTAGLTAKIERVLGGIKVTITNTGPDTYNIVEVAMVGSVHEVDASIDDKNGGCLGVAGQPSSVACAVQPPFAPGQTHVINIKTDGPYPDNGGAALYGSTDGFTGLTRVGAATGPAAVTPPATQPCKCLTLTARILPSSLKFTNPGETGGMHLEFTVAWTLNCLTGSGGCNGALDLVAPSGAGYKSSFKKPGGNVACKGACAKLTTGTQHFVLIGNRGLGGDKRGKAVKSIPIVVKRTCQGKAVAPIKLVLVFNPHTALVDKAKSKLR